MPDHRIEKTRGLLVLSLVLAASTLALVWLPELMHYHIRFEAVSETQVNSGRETPPDAVLDEIRKQRFLSVTWQDGEQLTVTAEKLLMGRAEVPGYPAINIHVPFDPVDLSRGSSLWQLQFAGLIVPEILIDAYRSTGREEFYNMARDIIVAWEKYEGHAWFNRGFLWNDHAVADRVRTLVDFWCIYRHRADYRPEVANAVWRLVNRTTAFLIKPDSYTVATNHGVMQNLALWQACLSFPTLPETEQHKQLAFARLQEQFAFYVGPDGVILEHSAGYHEFGLELLGMVMRDASLLNISLPKEWAHRYEMAQEFYGELRRPDGSLPMFGDTGDNPTAKVSITLVDAKGNAAPLALKQGWKPRDPIALYPVAGYAVLWDGLQNWPEPRDLAQTVLAWSYFPGMGHKHSDEPSVLLWARGEDWWTSSGYWSYDDPERAKVECWAGSNAPHLVGEPCISNRTATLISSLSAPGLFAAEVERRGPGDLVIRRSVVHASPAIWVLIDECVGIAHKNMQTIWTAGPNIQLEKGATPSEFVLSGTAAQGRLRSYFMGPSSMKISSFRGSHEPFAGWTALRGVPKPTGAVVTEQPSERAWAMTVWVMDDGLAGVGSVEKPTPILDWQSPSDWHLRIPLPEGTREISRNEEKIVFGGAQKRGQPEVTGVLLPASPGISTQVGAVRESLQTAVKHFPRVRDLFAYRLRVSALILILIVLQELILFGWRKLGGRYIQVLRFVACLAWLAILIWAPLFYLRAS